MGFNIYFWGAFYPDDEDRLQKKRYPEGDSEEVLSKEDEETRVRRKELTHAVNGLIKSFNPDKLVLLFGGQFDKQRAVSLPSEWQRVTEPCSPQNVNKALLHYRHKTCSLLMPCGDLAETGLDEDEREII